MKLEDNAKVVVSVWGGGGADFVQFLAALAILPQPIWKKKLNSPYSFKWTEAKQLAQQKIEQNLLLKQTQRPLPCLLILSFFCATGTNIRITAGLERNTSRVFR